MNGCAMHGRCAVCGQEGPLTRTYYSLPIKCDCHSPEHFDLIDHCPECNPVRPATKIMLQAWQAEALLSDLNELSALRAEVERLRAKNDGYRADIEAGRLVRLPDFPQDMNDLLEPLKVQSALNSEMMKLNYRKEHKPDAVSILDYTIIAALNKVLTDARAALEKGAIK